MVKCKYCGQNISRLDKDICPFCGGKSPLEGTDASTQDVTKVLEQYSSAKKIKHHSRVVAAILSFLLGFLGINFLYVGRTKKFLISLCFSIVLIGGVGSVLFFLTPLKIFGYLIPYFLIEIVMIVVGINYLIRHDITDSNGEFLD